MYAFNVRFERVSLSPKGVFVWSCPFYGAISPFVRLDAPERGLYASVASLVRHPSSLSTIQSSFIEFKVGSETLSAWYTVAGDLRSGRRPLVVLHGGPGLPSPYMLPHLKLAELYGISVILYDQVGCGKSTSLRGRDPSFFAVELFMDELENVLAHFDITLDFDLLGHSWGGMLASDWVTARQPAGLHRLVLADSLASFELWQVGAHKLLARFPKEFQDMIKKHEHEGTTSDQEYQDGIMAFYQKHICTLDPWPQELNDSFAAIGEDSTVHTIMIGVSEFTITGTLKKWTVVDRLRRIACPTLIINGVDDESQDECVAAFFTDISKAKWVQFAASSHMPFLEETERYLEAVGRFLTM